MTLQRRLVSYALIVAFLGVLPVLATGSSRAASEDVYLALGDSIAVGYASSLPAKRGYPALLRDLMESQRLGSDEPGAVQLINLAEPGETAESFIDDGQLEAALETIEQLQDDERSLRTVTLTLGGNDALALWDLPGPERDERFEDFQLAFSQAIDELASALDGADADVVVTTFYDLTEGDSELAGSDSWWLAEMNQFVTDTAEDAGFMVIDLESLFRGRTQELTWFPADVHPNNTGHRSIAHTIWRQLEYDQTPPGVEITRPEGTTARSRMPTAHARVHDDVGIASVELFADGELVSELLFVASLDRYVGLWDGREFPQDEVELTVVATDVSGNEASDSVVIALPSR
jgi:lysophospholipase L1-like esterase